MRVSFQNLIGLVSVPLLGACASAPPHSVTAAPAAARAADHVAAPVAESPGQAEQPAESARRSVRSAAVWLASGVDSWFGDKPFEDGGKVSNGRLSVLVLKRQDASVDLKVRFNANFKLPNLENSAYLFIGRDNPRDLITDKPAAFTRQQQLLTERAANTTFFAGLGRPLGERVDFRLGFRGGLKPYAQARYRQPWQLGPADDFEFRETLFWSANDRFGSTTALSYDHAFSPTLAGRWLSEATITQTESRLEWHTSLGAYKLLGNQRLLSLELFASGERGSGVLLADYGVQTRWEQPVHKDWLLGELIIGHFWPRVDAMTPRGRAWVLGAGLKMKF